MKKYSLSVICVVLFALLAGCGSKETSIMAIRLFTQNRIWMMR